VTDIRITTNDVFPRYEVTNDWRLLDDGRLDERYALASAVMVALGTDALADRDDVLPDFSGDRAGWWGDLEPDIWDSWPIGSKLWLLRRDKITDPGSQRGATITKVERYAREALQPFLDRRIVSRIDVKAARVGLERIDVQITLYRGERDVLDMRYQVLWAAMLAEQE
jgi:phage gp46-like protein